MRNALYKFSSLFIEKNDNCRNFGNKYLIILGESNSHIKYSTKISHLSTKIYYIEYKNILYYVPKLHTKIF